MSTLVVITGASRGIGRSAAVAFAKDPRINKLSLCLIARKEDGLSQTKSNGSRSSRARKLPENCLFDASSW
jgi:hypothetical protein